METEIQYNGKTYRCIDGDWYDIATFIRVPRVLAQKLDSCLRAQNLSAVSPSKTRPSTLSEGSEESTFQHAEAFPIIAGIIREQSHQNKDYVTHRQIVDAFLAHPAGNNIAAHAAGQQQKPIITVAANIVAWFSKRFTEGQTPYQDEFERERQDERWAYRATPPDKTENLS